MTTIFLWLLRHVKQKVLGQRWFSLFFIFKYLQQNRSGPSTILGIGTTYWMDELGLYIDGSKSSKSEVTIHWATNLIKQF